jgi:cytochrome c oxidase subunit IV
MAHDAADIDRHVRTYVMVFASLLVLTGVTVGVYYLHLPVLPAIGLALVIATIKATLVACFFMHLISEKHLIFAVLILTVMFFVVLLLLPTLSSDLGQVKI